MWQKQVTKFIEVAGSQSGFPKKPFSPLMSNRCLVSSIKMLKTVHQRCVMRMRVSPIDVRVRMGDAIGPFQLANGFEAVIGYECQERSNPLSLILTMHAIHARCDKASEWVGGSFPVRNSFASYGASTVTRTSGRGHVEEAKTNVIEVGRVLNPGFPFSPLNVHFCVQFPAQRC